MLAPLASLPLEMGLDGVSPYRGAVASSRAMASSAATVKTGGRSKVEVGILPAVEGGISPPGQGTEVYKSSSNPRFYPPGGTPGSTAGGTPAATVSSRATASSAATVKTIG